LICVAADAASAAAFAISDRLLIDALLGSGGLRSVRPTGLFEGHWTLVFTR
jgi:hypothetical protein